MTFDYTDALLLESIKLSQSNDEGATLSDIIKWSDYINHSIMTYQEFVSGTEKLKCLGLVKEQKKRLRTTDIFESWWTKKYGEKSRFGLLKAMEEIEKYLNRDFGKHEQQLDRKATKFTREDFELSTTEYLKWADETLRTLDKGKGKRK
ncbi:MAG: hypothetical protein IM618_18205 [Cytophagales bacterium]|nr:hypothetical protein [Cytophagales bacterium]MCA6377631.1 hypothetical protein [Cytophagales bacterium]MCA6386244.1 hypothetical protein [Cytophagales bacterium]